MTPNNILFITTDQHHFSTLGATNPKIKTPNLDHLCSQGARFDRAYCANPTCSPSRATMITGLYLSMHGCWSIGVKLPEDVPTVGELFQQYGYESILVGKAHFQPLRSEPGSESIECQPQLRDLDFWRNFHGPWYGFKHVETARMHANESHAGQHYTLWLEEKGLANWRDYFDPWPPQANSNYDGPYYTRDSLTWDLPEEYHPTHWVGEGTAAQLERCTAQNKPFFLLARFLAPTRLISCLNRGPACTILPRWKQANFPRRVCGYATPVRAHAGNKSRLSRPRSSANPRAWRASPWPERKNMRILFIDIDTLRPDHLGCYGYHRSTSSNLDWIASQGCRFNNCYVSDAPCLPSRAALWTGRTGFHNGVINHGGVAADPFHEGAGRQFRDSLEATGWIPQLRKTGLYPVTISPFGERHSAWWWYAGWREAYNPGKGGSEVADDITPLALEWIQRNARRDNWFLHVNYWDPHTPYRTPLEYGNPFANDPLPDWLTEDVLQRCWNGFGPHSAREPHGDPDGSAMAARYPRVPPHIDSLDSAKQWIDGYDAGVWYADRHVGFLLDVLRQQQVLDDMVIIVSSDHGENLGELNVWGDHQHADHITSQVPLLVRWPGVTRPHSTDGALHYHFDWAATMIELLGGSVPGNWDGIPFTSALQEGRAEGRDALVVSQAAWSCMRSVRFCHQGEDYICLRTYHDGYKELEPVMLFNLTHDPHEQHDLAATHPELVNLAMAKLANWQHQQMLTHTTDIDPMLTVLREGGPYHTRGTLPAYLVYLRSTGRSQAADRLVQRHPQEAGKQNADCEINSVRNNPSQQQRKTNR